MESEYLTHNFEPVFDSRSKILILGTFPSVKSRETKFYYGHPQNRFWRVLSKLYNCETPVTVDEKKTFLLKNGVAVWDVIKSCEITGSADSTIKSVKVNDLSVILENAQIKTIYANGKTAEKLYNQYMKKKTKRDITALPSTSPANAAWTFERLCGAWQVILKED